MLVVPRDILPVPPELLNLLPTLVLVLLVLGEVIQRPGERAGGGVVALKHKGVHLVPDLLVRQALTATVLATQTVYNSFTVSFHVQGV